MYKILEMCNISNMNQEEIESIKRLIASSKTESVIK